MSYKELLEQKEEEILKRDMQQMLLEKEALMQQQFAHKMEELEIERAMVAEENRKMELQILSLVLSPIIKDLEEL